MSIISWPTCTNNYSVSLGSYSMNFFFYKAATSTTAGQGTIESATSPARATAANNKNSNITRTIWGECVGGTFWGYSIRGPDARVGNMSRVGVISKGMDRIATTICNRSAASRKGCSRNLHVKQSAWCSRPDADVAGIRVVDVAVEAAAPEFRADRSGIALLTLRALRPGGTGLALWPLRAGSGRAPDPIAGAVIGQHVAVTAAGNIESAGIEGVRFGGQERTRRQFRAGIDRDAELVRLVKRQVDLAAAAGADDDGEQAVVNLYAAMGVGIQRAAATGRVDVEAQGHGAGDPAAAGVLEHPLVGDRIGDLGLGDRGCQQEAGADGQI